MSGPTLRNTLFGHSHDFDGGLFLPEHKSETARIPIRDLPLSPILHIPLQVARDASTRPLVRAGDRVIAGQRLAEALTDDALPVHAPAAGRILSFQPAITPQDGPLPGLLLETDAADQRMPAPVDWESESVIGLLAGCGVMCHAPRMPVHLRLRQAAAAGVTELIINAMETEPYLVAELRTLVEQPGRMMDAACELADALGAARVLFAIPQRHRHLLRRFRAEAAGRTVEIVPLDHRYPQCHPVLLVKSLLDREIEPGGDVLDVGALVLPLATVRAAADALLDARPVTRALLTIAGDLVERPGAYRVPVGTTLDHLLDQVGAFAPPAQSVWGGILTGLEFHHPRAVVTADASALLLFADNRPNNPVPCIRCGWCTEDCPVGVDPSLLFDLHRQPGCTDDQRRRLDACIDCALCSYVCPSELPLAAGIRLGREQFNRRP